MEQMVCDGNEIVCGIHNFSLSFRKGNKWYPAVSNISLAIKKGEMTALVGESGCGKSMTALSLMGLQPEKAKVSGSIQFEGQELVGLNEKQWSSYRGNRISMIFQEPMTALNPLIPVGKQILESVREHQKVSRKEGKEQVLAMMHQVGLPDVKNIYGAYPHQLSGGQRQRIMIAMAFMNHPSLLIADEPTTALDVTIQAQIMQLMKQMNRELGSAVLLISHDLGAVRNLCSQVSVMYAGHIVESGETKKILTDPKHPYTKGLLAAIPGHKKKEQELASIPGAVPAIYARKEIGCAFCNRCEWRQGICERETPKLEERDGRMVACHNKENNQFATLRHIDPIQC